jgi:hypothetical protein
MSSNEDFLLLFQLIRGIGQTATRLENAYNSSNKAEFESYKKIVLEYQKKIAFILG